MKIKIRKRIKSKSRTPGAAWESYSYS
jgi:hypothetical protein